MLCIYSESESESELESELESDPDDEVLFLSVWKTFAFFDLRCPPSEDDDELPWLEGALRFSILDGNFSDAALELPDSLSLTCVTVLCLHCLLHFFLFLLHL